MSSVQYPNLSPNGGGVHYTEYTPLVNDRYFFIYRHNDSFLERLRRALAFVLLTALLSCLFFVVLSMLLQVISYENPYTYYLFTKRWPAAECNQQVSKCVPNVPGRWLIHGLWPENSNNTWPEYCNMTSFNMTEVQSLKPELQRDWPNLLRDQSDDSLWVC